MNSADRTATPVPLVSVVIPCFNRAALLHKAIDSVLQQSHADWELIVVDDASTDDLPGALAPYAGDARIRCVRHGANAGVSAARNTGVATARGRFVAFLDSDDEWLPAKLQRQLQAVLAAPEPERVFCVTRTRVEMPGGWHRLRPLAGPRPGSSFAEFLYNEGGFAQCSSFLLSRALALATPFRIGLRQYEDHLFFAEVGAAGARYHLVDEALTIWHNDERPDRLGRADDLDRAERFIALARPVLSERALLGFQARAVFHLLWQRSAWQASALLWRAHHSGALSARQAALLYLRNLAPDGIYQVLRRIAARAERPAGGTVPLAPR